MTYTSESNHQPGLTLPITSSARQLAQQFAQPLVGDQLQQQVRRNTLAMLAVRDYLELMGIETDLQSSECWNPLFRLTADVSDLYLPELGHLECRGIQPGETVYQLPDEVLADRIGYIVVEIQERMATILGFTPTGTPKLSIRRLQSIEELLSYLHRLRQPQVVKGVNLSQWFEQVFDNGWQTLDYFLGSSVNLAPSLRSYVLRDTQTSVQAGKLINLNLELGHRAVVLLIALTPAGREQVGIQVQVHPAFGETYLPPNMEITVLSETGQPLKHVCSRSLDNYIQLPFFQGYPGERFQLALSYEQVQWTEQFSI
ncbi:MAG: DUF1822 family protein [Microcoleaceae cyanobacterium]